MWCVSVIDKPHRGGLGLGLGHLGQSSHKTKLDLSDVSFIREAPSSNLSGLLTISRMSVLFAI